MPKHAIRVLIAILVLAVPAQLPGCGPFLPEALFHIPLRPEKPDDFARGRLGILQPTYERFYQVIAYRWLMGAGLNDAERQAAFTTPGVSGLQPGPYKQNVNPWLAARNRVPGIASQSVFPWRTINEAGVYEEYLNCNDDAFRAAAATLQDRILKLDAPAVKDWIAAQDIVFSDCSKGAEIPKPAADPRLRADRAYQIAAAKFYSRQFDAARQDFETIAQDQSSPWHGIAPYLAARCLIRGGNWQEARTRLERIAADPALQPWHASAAGLLGFVRSHADPAHYMHEVALALVKPNSQATIERNLADYRLLFDKGAQPEPADDLTDWITSFQGAGGALEKWRAKKTLPWLVAALQQAKPGDQAASELVAAAREVKPDSPAYIDVEYHMVRLLPPDDARLKADDLLKSDLPESARNLIRAERIRLARNFEEFLRFAPRRPVATLAEEVEDIDSPEQYLAPDSTEVFNRELPLPLWKQAAASDLLPQHVRQALQQAIFVRSVLLSDAPKFDDVFTILKTPGMRPAVDPGYGRFTKELDKIDPFRDNWWPGASSAPRSDVTPPEAPPFLAPADRTRGEAESKKLAAVPTAPDWLGSQTLAFAQAHPDDPRLPEALYLVVRATRYGMTDAQSGDISHRAFDLLHRRYGETEWARKTPYWFK